MTSRERVKRAIRFENPDRIPIWLFNKDQTDGDVLWYDFRVTEGEYNTGYHGGNVSEWGYTWKTLDDGTMGQISEPLIPDWEDLDKYQFPTRNPEKRFRRLEEFKALSRDHYRLAMSIITGFTTYTFLRGFENSMMDFMEEPEKAEYLLDRIFGFEKELMTMAAEAGFDGFHFGDDWGTQSTLMIAPEMWRKLFKPRYKDQFDHAHSVGLDVWYHSCGNITDILEDFHEIGVDVMNISQPNVVDIRGEGHKLQGRQCFLLPISYQTVSITGTPSDIMAEGKRLHDLMGVSNGGFIGYVEEYGCMGMSEENFHACIASFRELS